MPLKINASAPEFSLPSTSGKQFDLSNLKNQACIIYFYPKDFTTVCTKEACGFRDQWHIFEDLNIPVIGISTDSIETHLKFKKQYELPFELLADEKGKVAKLYKAQIPLVGLTRRITYLLDNQHRIAAIHNEMFDSKGHIEEMLNALK